MIPLKSLPHPCPILAARRCAFFVLLALLTVPFLNAQTSAGTSAQQLAFAGLRSVGAAGQANAVQVDSAGNLYLLLDQKDGVRVLKTDASGSSVLAQAQIGTAGDSGVALALDPVGNVYVAGTSTSGTFAGTAGAAFPGRTDASTNSFIARFDQNLKPVFVSFTGGPRMAVSSIAVTSDAVFVAGIVYGSGLPVTPNGIQQAPAPGSVQNGFVERFSSSGSTLVYATYLSGAQGDTTPIALAADVADEVFIAGSTTASGYPTVSALVPAMLSNPSGFLTKLTPAGDGIVFSTFVPGAGLTSLAVDASSQTLLASGSVALGQFPIDTAQMPLVPASYQVLLRLPLDGSAVTGSTVIAPGTQSSVAAAGGGSVWVGGTLSAPLLPVTPLAGLGTGFAVRVNGAGTIDQTARFGGLPNGNPSFASLPASLSGVAVDAAGSPVFAGSVQPTASVSLLATQTFDLPLRNSPTATMPSSVRDARQTAASCSGSLCAGSAAYLARLSVAATAPALAFSVDDLPWLVLRNLGSQDAQGLTITATGSQAASNCPGILAAGAECDVLLSDGAAGTVTAAIGNGTPQTASFSAYAAPSSTLVFFPKELDFGIQAAGGVPAARTITVSNLGTVSQTFTSSLDSSSRLASPFSEVASDCTLAGSATGKVLAPGGTCHITIGFTPSSSAAGDGPLSAQWSIGSRDVLLTGFSQAAGQSLSAGTLDFGIQIDGGLRQPRYLYLSNNAGSAVSHSPVRLATAFTVTDGCPTLLAAHSVCRLRVDYLAASSTSNDSTMLTIDGLSVLLTGSTLPAQGFGGTGTNPGLSVAPSAIAFADPVVVTGISASTRTVTVTNTGGSPFSLVLALTGDFIDTTSCTATLAAGQSCAVAIQLTPSRPGMRQGLLAVTAGSAAPVYVALSGAGSAILTAPNDRIDFGNVVTGQPAVQFFKIVPTFSALTAVATGPYSVALVEDIGFGHGLPPASAYKTALTASCRNCYLAVRFQPTVVGSQAGTLALSSTAAGATFTLALSGTGTAATGLILTPPTQEFGSAPVDSTGGPVLFTLTNLDASGAAVPVTPPVLTGDFLLTGEITGAQPCAGSLAYSASCAFTVQFAPTATGVRSGTLTLAAGAGGATAALSGIGTADPGIAIRPLALTFNAVPGTSATRQTVTVVNTGASAALVGLPTAGTPSFSATNACAALAPGASCEIAVVFTPGTAHVLDTLSIPVTLTLAGGMPQTATYTVALDGAFTTATAGLQIVPQQAAYGPDATGTVGSLRQFTVTNLTAKPLALAVEIPRQYVLEGPACAGLAPSSSCSFALASLPLTNGDSTGTLFARGTPSDGSATLNGLGFVDAYGVGQGALTVTGGLIVNGVFNFGQVSSGQTATQVFTLTNRAAAGGAPVTVRRITSQPPFLSTTTCGAAMAPGQSCTATVTYQPSNQVATGTASPPSVTDLGALTIESDAASSPDTLNLTGSGAAVASDNPVNAAVLAAYSLSQSSLSFARTTVGNISAAQTVSVANTGTTTLHILSLVAPADFTVQNACTTLAPASSCTLTVTSTPQATGITAGALEIRSDAATSLEFISLFGEGQPSPLALMPGALDFGSVIVGSTGTLTVQVANTSAAPVVIQSLTATGDYAVGGNCPAAGGALAAMTSCTVQVTFSPTAAGTRGGTFMLASTASALPLTVSLTGIGTQPRLIASPGSLGFGSVVVGVGSNLTLTLTNAGTAPATALAFTSLGDFQVTIPCAAAILAPGQSCAVQVTFTPSALGARVGSLTITNSSPGSPLTVPLSGIGVASGGFTLTVDGGASSSITVKSGLTANYRLAITPTRGFNGAIALTCTAIRPAQYAFCSLTPSQLALSGAAQNAVATLNTVTSIAGNASPGPLSQREEAVSVCLLLPGLIWALRRRRTVLWPMLLSLLLTALALVSTGCGSGADPNLRYAPVGTYQYQVTASSTSGVLSTQTVTLNLTVTAR